MARYQNKQPAIVTITFVDGEVKEYPIDASTGISGHLARQIAEGAVNLFTHDRAICIPSAQIRTLELTAAPASVGD